MVLSLPMSRPAKTNKEDNQKIEPVPPLFFVLDWGIVHWFGFDDNVLDIVVCCH